MHIKEYIVDCEGHMADEKVKMLRDGILLDGDARPTLPAVCV
jgi:16S rRNA U516 pseudouridylate synthase RsuA-like enzyme